MELVEGRTLTTCISEGPLPQAQAVRYGSQLADALVHAHQRGIVHGDFNSSSVIISHEGQTKVLDFGLARQIRKVQTAAAITDTTLTEPCIPVGTLAYLAPEQMRGSNADALKGVVERCLERLPRRRYTSAAEVGAALDAIQSELSTDRPEVGAS